MTAEELDAQIERLMGRKLGVPDREPEINITRLDVRKKPTEGEFVTFFHNGLHTDKQGKYSGLSPLYGMRLSTGENSAIEFNLGAGLSYFPLDVWERIEKPERVGGLGALLRDGHAIAFYPGQAVRVPPLNEAQAGFIMRQLGASGQPEDCIAELESHAALLHKGSETRKAALVKIKLLKELAAKRKELD